MTKLLLNRSATKVGVTSVQERLDALKTDALNKLTVYLSISTFFLFLAFLFRLKNFDWQNLYFLDLFCFVIGTIILFFKNKLSYNVLVFSYLSMGFTIAVVELICLGISGMGEISLLFCIMLSLFYLNKKSTIIVAIIVISIYSIALHQYLHAGRMLSENDMQFVSWYSAWIGRLVSYVVFFTVIGVSVYYLQTQIISLLEKVETQKRTIEEQKSYIEYLANHDALTGLPSLRVVDSLFEEVLKYAEKDGHQSALLFLDLDGFKAINDLNGHGAGDEVLRKVAERLSSIIRKCDTACRVGGDEFLIIVEKITNNNDIEGLCQRLINTISKPVLYKGAELRVGVSIGAAIYPNCGKSAASLRLKADEHMYQVKRSGKNNYRICGQV